MHKLMDIRKANGRSRKQMADDLGVPLETYRN